MLALFDNSALIDYHNQVGVADRAQPVGDDKAGPSLHQLKHGALNLLFCAGIDGTGRFVQDQDGRIRQDRPGNGQKLPLPLAEIAPVFRKDGVVAIRQADDEGMGVGQFCRLFHFGVGGIKPAVADILLYRSREEIRILEKTPRSERRRSRLI